MLDQPGVAGDRADSPYEPRDLRVRRTLGKVVPRNIGSLGDDENVSRRERVDVVEREYLVVFVDSVRRNLVAQDSREDVALVVRLGRIDRHWNLEVNFPVHGGGLVSPPC